MDTKAIIVSAVMLGAIGGYAWSSHGSPAAPTAAPAKATMMALPESPEELPAAEDREWAARSDDSAQAAMAPASGPATAPVASATPDRSVYYSGCNAVRAAGKAPLHAGQPGYRSEMDGDGDGIACEPHRRF
ncbi:MAG: excalibur calcium-binding domain-containing protein [Sphingomicrobium sp.]